MIFLKKVPGCLPVARYSYPVACRLHSRGRGANGPEPALWMRGAARRGSPPEERASEAFRTPGGPQKGLIGNSAGGGGAAPPIPPL